MKKCKTNCPNSSNVYNNAMVRLINHYNYSDITTMGLVSYFG